MKTNTHEPGRWRRFSRRTVLAAFGAAIGTAMAVGGYSFPANAQEKTVVMAIEGEPGQLDPHTHALWLTYREVYLMFESFTQQDLSVTDVEIPPIKPALADGRWVLALGSLYLAGELRPLLRSYGPQQCSPLSPTSS